MILLLPRCATKPPSCNSVVRWIQSKIISLDHGATDNGAKGASFPRIELGVRTQVQHLKIYASTGSLNGDCVDPRFENVVKAGYRYRSKPWTI
jgi:hypothetical protein